MQAIRAVTPGTTVSNDNILSALRSVVDPELGVNIVDLGLVQQVVCTDGGIKVALIMTTPACPLGEMIVEEAEQVLAGCFPEAGGVEVRLLRGVLWSPDRLSDAGRRQLGLSG